MDTIGTLSIGKLAIQLTTPLLLYINRANFSQASRGFASDSWAFLYLRKVLIYMASLSPLPKENLLHCDIVGSSDIFTCWFLCFLVYCVFTYLIPDFGE